MDDRVLCVLKFEACRFLVCNTVGRRNERTQALLQLCTSKRSALTRQSALVQEEAIGDSLRSTRCGVGLRSSNGVGFVSSAAPRAGITR